MHATLCMFFSLLSCIGISNDISVLGVKAQILLFSFLTNFPSFVVMVSRLKMSPAVYSVFFTQNSVNQKGLHHEKKRTSR